MSKRTYYVVERKQDGTWCPWVSGHLTLVEARAHAETYTRTRIVRVTETRQVVRGR